MTDESEPQPVFEFADALMQAGKHCATLARAKTGKFFERGFVPNPDDPTATVTFILFEGKTYTVTAGHVMDIFEEAARVEGCYPEGYFVPARPGALIGPPFVRPPARFTDRAPDIALRPIDPALPASLGKRPFELQSSAVPIFPLSAALAIGFPTASKEVLKDSQGERLALLGVQAIAQGLGSPDTDQIQFWSEISERSLISKLSGMSGGPVFWQGRNPRPPRIR